MEDSSVTPAETPSPLLSVELYSVPSIRLFSKNVEPGRTYYLHSPISPYYSYSKVPLELLFPTTDRRSDLRKSYVFCSAPMAKGFRSTYYYLLAPFTSTHTTLLPAYSQIKATCL
uniref:Uncharacterized protein n=1 Tax=Picea glauca TaxID=3330 RepID=A0A117NHV9_PICGL|nr:hypothetical protein ABT39_MTgene4345 [Picea glauca]